MKRRSFLKATAAAAAVSLIPLSTLGKDTTENLRTAEVYDKGNWIPKQFIELKKDDIFRLRDPDGSLVDKGHEHEISLALSDAAPTEAGVYGLRIAPFTIITKDSPFAHRVRVMKDGKQLALVKQINLRTGIAMITNVEAVAKHQGKFYSPTLSTEFLGLPGGEVLVRPPGNPYLYEFASNFDYIELRAA